MSARLRLIDPCCPKPYASEADLAGLGGTEATALRITKALAPTVDIAVEQAARLTEYHTAGLTFRALDLTSKSDATTIVINSWKVALTVARRNPNARVAVWQHVVPGRHNRILAKELMQANIALICVSRSLARRLAQMLDAPVKTAVVYNPVADDLRPDHTPRDPDLLLFASAPHKALDQVLAAFSTLRLSVPSLRLEVADPGYLAWPVGELPAGVVHLGRLSNQEVVAKMRTALCLFYPQTRFAETFGLVIAEANAVGMPALLHRGLGANNEVASDPTQCIDGSNPDEIARRITAWRARPPIVTMNPDFRMSSVLTAWQRLLQTAPHPALT